LYKMVVAQKYILAKHFDGPPKETDLQIVEEELPPLKDGEFLAQAVYLSVDPYMRAYAHKLPLGATMVGTQIAKVIESKNKNFPVGKHVVAKFDWRSHTISTGDTGANQGPASHAPYIVPEFGDLPLSWALGVLGMPGTTAYFGFLEKCRPKAGETVVVTGAAGAVGSIVGQIAKIKGCKVVGVTGSDTKGKFLVDELGFDGYVNYKRDDMEEHLVKATPNGIDCYFDNVAGEISTKIMKHMNMFGRISICGSISSYNTDVNTPPKVPCVQLHMLNKQLVMEGFQNYLYYDRSFEGINQNLHWAREGKLKYMETVTEGFENMTNAFIEMLEGKNTGKAIVKVRTT